MSKDDKESVIKNGVRLDGRKLDEPRPLKMEVGVLKRADGSAMVRMGNTIALAGVFGPRKVFPKHQENAEKAIVRVEYRMAPFSTSDRARPGPSRRSQEISMVIEKALTPILFLEEFPKTAIDITIEILQADASTRCAALNAAVLALADAGVPMKDFIASCAAGVVDGHIVLDVAGKEDTEGEVDLPIAYYPKKKEITLMQMDGIVSKEQFRKIVSLAVKGCEKIYDAQRKTIQSKYQTKFEE
jgi:exosome complex component RRP41